MQANLAWPSFLDRCCEYWWWCSCLVKDSSLVESCITCYLYCYQVYPTTIRALGLGICSGMARIGALVTPFVAQVGLASLCYSTSLSQLVSEKCEMTACMAPVHESEWKSKIVCRLSSRLALNQSKGWPHCEQCLSNLPPLSLSFPIGGGRVTAPIDSRKDHMCRGSVELM